MTRVVLLVLTHSATAATSTTDGALPPAASGPNWLFINGDWITVEDQPVLTIQAPLAVGETVI